MTTADYETITVSVDAATLDRLKFKGVSVDEYCQYAIDRQLSDDDGGLRAKRKGRRLTPSKTSRNSTPAAKKYSAAKSLVSLIRAGVDADCP